MFTNLSFYWQLKVNECDNGTQLYEVCLMFYRHNPCDKSFEEFVATTDCYYNSTSYEKGKIDGLFQYMRYLNERM